MESETVRVVIAESCPLVRDALQAALEEDPRLVVAASAPSGTDALGLAFALVPDVVVLGVELMAPAEVIVLAELGRGLPSVRAVVITASEDPSDLQLAVQAGAIGYLNKRATLPELRRAVIEAHHGRSVVDPLLAPGAKRRARWAVDHRLV
ncbi:MAG: two component transcriptional regulator, LuxR family [Solirubrobacterales bacterium]|nr:two component transcriptional regulator, LuxR family [Solirubrobacterales bacterium]